MHVAPTAPTQAVLYLRESNGDEDGIDRHRKDCQRIAAERGWIITAEYVDRVTASDKRKDRPGYDAMVKAYEAGEFTAMLCWDLDRLNRQPRQLEDWIDAAEERGLAIVTANGEADLTTDGGRLYARIKVAVAKGEVERKAARQRLAAAQRAEQGKPPRGVRLMGYTPDGTVVEHEAQVVREMFARFHAGASLREVVKWLNDTKVPTRRGGEWSPSSVRDILVNARYAGRAVYQGKANGHAGGWQPLVSEAVFDLVHIRLSDPRRRNQVGTDRKHLGSGLFLCAVCNRPVVSHTGGGVVRYRCPAAHVLRSIAPVDRFVLAVLRERLARPDLADVLTAPEDGKARELTAEITRLRARLKKIEADYDAGLIDGRRYKIATEKVTSQLDAARNAQARQAAGSGVAGTVLAPDPVAAFGAAPLGIKRAVLAFFLTVRLHPAPRGCHFSEDSCEILPAARLDRTRMFLVD